MHARRRDSVGPAPLLVQVEVSGEVWLHYIFLSSCSNIGSLCICKTNFEHNPGAAFRLPEGNGPQHSKEGPPTQITANRFVELENAHGGFCAHRMDIFQPFATSGFLSL